MPKTINSCEPYFEKVESSFAVNGKRHAILANLAANTFAERDIKSLIILLADAKDCPSHIQHFKVDFKQESFFREKPDMLLAVVDAWS